MSGQGIATEEVAKNRWSHCNFFPQAYLHSFSEGIIERWGHDRKSHSWGNQISTQKPDFCLLLNWRPLTMLILTKNIYAKLLSTRIKIPTGRVIDINKQGF